VNEWGWQGVAFEGVPDEILLRRQPRHRPESAIGGLVRASLTRWYQTKERDRTNWVDYLRPGI